ncbi:hypothetical protein J6Z48_00370 [bacterium]|nr:hypothetical protein [bacterium]
MDIVSKILTKGTLGSSIWGTLESGVKNLETSNGNETTDTLIQKIVDVAIPLSVVCAFALFVYGGYMMMSSQGNTEKIEEARSVIVNAVIGLVVILSSTAILMIINEALGLNIEVFK